MQDGGAYPFDKKHSFLKPGDNFALPANNTINSIFQTNLPRMVLRGTLVAPGSYLLTTCNQETGAGFYSSVLGPLPFAFGRVPPESVSVYVVQP